MAVERQNVTYSIGVKYHPTVSETSTKTKTITYINMPARASEQSGDLDPYYNLMFAINSSIIGGLYPTITAGTSSDLTEGE